MSVKNSIISSTVGTHIVCLSNGFFSSTFCCGTVHTCWTSTPLYQSCDTAGLKWDIWFSQQCCWGFRPSGIWRRVCGSLAPAVPSKRREPFAEQHILVSQTSIFRYIRLVCSQCYEDQRRESCDVTLVSTAPKQNALVQSWNLNSV
jgi:hypothetical protein